MTIVGNIKSGELYVSKEANRLLKKRSVVFSGQNQNKYNGDLFLCVVRGTHFQVPERKFIEEFLFNKTNALIFQIHFCQENLHVSGSSSAHHQEFSTVHSALV
jgi:hypothetical protein